MFSFWSRLYVVDFRRYFVSQDALVLPLDDLQRGIYVDATWLSKQVILPFGPLWTGIVFNTIFYAALGALLYAALIIIRGWRRVHKRLCVKCAYPIGESDVCTECGHALRRQST
jgi:hypothetical protein